MTPVLTMDFETDPFEYGKTVEPFAVGVFNGHEFYSCWSKQCPAKVVKYLDKLEPSVIYMHNGGRFDIFFLMQYLEAEMRIINGRIVSCWLGRHEIRDSYAILPFALAAYKKDDIDINKLHRDCRQQHKAEILSYLRGDCVYLHELVAAFRDEFGDFLTIGSAAMNQLQKFHKFQKGTSYMDEKIRKQFFFGGRVQCFQSGIIKTPWKLYDVNSMYPHVMKNFRHPTGDAFDIDNRITRKTYFIVADGVNRGAFPIRNKNGGIDFTGERGRYACTIHEWDAAEQTGTFKPERIIKTYNFEQSISFGDYIDHFYAARIKAKKNNDAIRSLFYKLILNSSYGKFAQNPDNFCDYAITHGQQLGAPWQEKFIHNSGEYVIWQKGIERHSYYNIAIGASITGAARSVLLLALSRTTNRIYCDTDSILCSELGKTGTQFSDTELGAWKLESQGTSVAIAGKKMYACFDGKQCVKKATKGARLSADEITRVASGETVTFRKLAPTFKLDGRVQFLERKIRRTV